MTPLPLAVIGCGDVAHRDYLPEMHRLNGRVELVHACARSEASARATAKRYNFRAWSTDYNAMLRDTDAQAVLNLTPHQLHFEVTRAALQAGKHVYSEKPLCSSYDDAMRLKREAEKRDLTLVCAPCVALFPQVIAAREIVASGELGQVWAARGHGMLGVPPWSGYAGDISAFFARGGGALRDMGVYALQTLCVLFGSAKRVSALASQGKREFTVSDGREAGRVVPVEEPDNWQISIDFGNGRLAQLSSNSLTDHARGPQLELWGDKGGLEMNLIDVGAPLHVGTRSGWQARAQPRTGRASGPDHLLGVEHLVECVQEKRTPILSVGAASHVLEIIDAAYASVESGRTVELKSRFDA